MFYGGKGLTEPHAIYYRSRGSRQRRRGRRFDPVPTADDPYAKSANTSWSDSTYVTSTGVSQQNPAVKVFMIDLHANAVFSFTK